MPELTDKQTKFCEEYALSRNGTAAAILAGYSQNSAAQQASRLLSNVKIKDKVAQILAAATGRIGLELDQVLEELRTIAFANMSDYAKWGESSVTLIASEKLSQEQLKAVESVAETSGRDGRRLLRVRLHSKLRALESLIKIFELSEIEKRLNDLEEHLSKRPRQ